MMKEKILFLDVDGTLVDYENHLPESAVKAVREARRNGHRVYICTGRSKAEVYPAIWAVGLDGMIGGNGSYVEDGDTVVMHQMITADQARHIVDWLHGRGLEFYLESNSGLYASEHFAEVSQQALMGYQGMPETAEAQAAVKKFFPDMIFGGELYRSDLNKVSFLLHSLQDYEDAVKEFPDLAAGTWGGRGEQPVFGDLGVKNITKANAIRHLLEYLHRDVEDTIAFGDAKSDIPMLEYCHTGVAMGSGGEEIRAMADYVTGDVDKDGLAEAFRHLGLIV